MLDVGPPRFVIDSNIWIYAHHTKKPENRRFAEGAIRKAYVEGVVLYCKQTKQDLKQALRSMCKCGAISEEMLRGIMKDMETRSRYFLFDYRRYAKEHAQDLVVCPDYMDRPFLALADASGARAIVSNDRHLRDLGSYRGVAILTAREFCEEP